MTSVFIAGSRIRHGSEKIVVDDAIPMRLTRSSSSYCDRRNNESVPNLSARIKESTVLASEQNFVKKFILKQ